MIVALIDNGSLEPAAHRNLRAVAAAVSARAGVAVHAVSWKHSDRIPVAELDHTPAWTLGPFVRSLLALGQREFVFVPFFISAQGAIGSALRVDLEQLQRGVGGIEVTFTPGLADRGAIPAIVSERVRETLQAQSLRRPPVIVVDHGGPSAESAVVRERLTDEIRVLLQADAGVVVAASMEGDGYAHNRPLLADQLRTPGFDRGDVVIAPLFLSPGRHAGLAGDLAKIADLAGHEAAAPLRCHFTELVGTHPRVIDALADALRTTLTKLHADILT